SHSPRQHRYPPSFPTRRSSDLHTSRPAVPDWAILGAMNAAYRQLLDSFGRGWEAGDVDGIVSVFAPDAVFLETPFSEQSVGSDADRKSTRLNSSHLVISYAVFC